MERQEGYYWVNDGSRFIIAEYYRSNSGGYWLTFGESEGCWSDDKDFSFINENRIKAPGELPE